MHLAAQAFDSCRGEDGFHLPPRSAWDAAVTPRTRLVVLCNPNNPTGTVYSREEQIVGSLYFAKSSMAILRLAATASIT